MMTYMRFIKGESEILLNSYYGYQSELKLHHMWSACSEVILWNIMELSVHALEKLGPVNTEIDPR